MPPATEKYMRERMCELITAAGAGNITQTSAVRGFSKKLKRKQPACTVFVKLHDKSTEVLKQMDWPALRRAYVLGFDAGRFELRMPVETRRSLDLAPCCFRPFNICERSKAGPTQPCSVIMGMRQGGNPVSLALKQQRAQAKLDRERLAQAARDSTPHAAQLVTDAIVSSSLRCNFVQAGKCRRGACPHSSPARMHTRAHATYTASRARAGSGCPYLHPTPEEMKKITCCEARTRGKIKCNYKPETCPYADHPTEDDTSSL
jgi:hypothetical protein